MALIDAEAGDGLAPVVDIDPYESGGPDREGPSYRTVALIVACALFMNQLDSTVLTTALPTMSRDFRVPVTEMSLALTAYLLALAVFIPASGIVADRFGARSVFQAAIGVFVLGSIGCGLSRSMEWLVAARFFQGMGGAMMMPVGRLIVLRSVKKRDLISAMSWLIMPAMLGPVLGPPLGGFIVTYFDWRWIFWLNLPIGIVGLLLVWKFIPNVYEEFRRPFDLPGFILSGIALACLVFGLETISRSKGGIVAPLLLALGAAAALGYLVHARSTEHPILDLKLFRIPTFRLAFAAGSLSRITQGAQPFLLALIMQLGFGLSPAHSGLITIAPTVGSFGMKALVRRILARTGYRRGMLVMGVLAVAAYATCGFIGPGWSFPTIFVLLIICGFLMSFQFTSLNTLAYGDVPKREMSAATSFYATFQQLLLSLGICTAAGVLHLSMLVGGRGVPSFPDFSAAFWTVTAISLVAVIPIARLEPNAGAKLSGKA
jgi:EmrB/QacA subfamily drug resistance transporter